MALVLSYTQKVRQALAAPADLGIDALVLVGVAGLIAAVAMMFGHATQAMSRTVVIDLRFRALPWYTLLSLGRGFSAYAISLIFTLIYGTIAAHNRVAEKVMIPALDVLQSIPVLGFLPGLVLGMIAVFPNSNIGLEIACVIMIFTAQAWNMTFSYHGSVKGIPSALREVAAIQGLSGWQIFKLLELPAAMIGLVWNSMMSMAGGWFFLTVNEAFTLGDKDYRLQGIGSYMNEAITQGNVPAEIAAVLAMVCMIVAVDQIFWRPIVVWSQRFKMEDASAADVPSSWVVNLFQRSRLLMWLRWAWEKRHRSDKPRKAFPLAARMEAYASRPAERRVMTWMVLALLAAAALWGMLKLISLLIRLPLYHAEGNLIARADWFSVILALLASFARTTAAVLLGALWTLPIGIIVGRSHKWSRRLQPIIQVLASFPAPMLFPLTVALLVFLRVQFTFGCVALMLLGTQWYILFNVLAGASAIPSELIEASDIYRVNRWQRWKRLYLPIVFPYLVTGLITAAGGAWNATIVSEYVIAQKHEYWAFGLGAKIQYATTHAQFPMLTASVVAMALFVVLLNRLIWKRLYRLAESRYSLNV